MKGLLGRKLGMTQVFNQDGGAVPVTVLEAGPCVVVQHKTLDKDGYETFQIGFQEERPKRVNEPAKGHFERAQVKPCKHLREIKFSGMEKINLGQELKVDLFKAGERVDIISTSKGKGFQGGMKRHKFGGGPNSHGGMSHRRPASGGETNAARRFPGSRGPGHMGDQQVTALGLIVERIDTDRNLLLVRGSVPGATGQVVTIRESVKKKRVSTGQKHEEPKDTKAKPKKK